MWRKKGYTLINILGLAIGMACFLLIFMFVWDESSFDKFHEKGEDIYRVALDRKYPGRMRSYAIIPHSYAETMKTDLPEVKEAVRLFYFQGNALSFKANDNVFEEPEAMWADSQFFELFTIPLLSGESATALNKPNTVVLTESAANKYFGTEDPIGKVLDIPGTPNDLVVTGICGDVPANSHLRFNLLISASSFNFLQTPNFVNFFAYTYLWLEPGTDPAALEAKFPQMVRKYAGGPIQRQFNVSYDDYITAGNGYDYYLQPLQDIYLTSNLENELKPPGSTTRNYIFGIIGLFILVIAIINFMNLSTARSTERAQEVGIRKTLGVRPKQLINQFLSEAILVSLFSLILSLVLLVFMLPLFNDLSGKTFTLGQMLSWQSIVLFPLLAVGIGLLAGIYPAAVLSRFRPIEVLKGKLTATRHGIALRNGLVVFQFMISVVLIISTIVVFNQLQFIRNKELGFNQEKVLSLRGANVLNTQTEAFKEELLKLPEVSEVGGCNTMPGEAFFGTSFRKEGDTETAFGSGITIDEDFINCLEMELLDGRNFSDAFNDSLSLLINETAVKELQMEDPIGKRLITINADFQTGEETLTTYTIVGLVKDFHFQSLHQAISPVYFFHNENETGASNVLSLRLQVDDFQQTIQKVENIWARFAPDQPFRYSFLEGDLSSLYVAEQVSQRIFGLFSLLAIFIACMGLLGLAAYITLQRTKEIGIRKVLGASTANLITLLSKDFLKLVFIALLIGSPVAWYAMNKWLENFAYRVDLNWTVFLLAGVLAIIIAFLTISFQAIKTARANPIKALKE